MDGIERLEKEALEMNNFSITNVFNTIKNKEELKGKFDNEEKTLAEMYEYIYKKSKAFMQNGVAMVSNPVVYSWAINYFKYTNEELGIKKDEKTTKPINITKNKEKKKKEIKEEKNENLQLSLFGEVDK